MKGECARSADIGAAIAGGVLSEDRELREHLAVCDACAELATVMSALRETREHARRHAPVPSAGLVWWRAELRARREAARKAAAPVTLVQSIALVGALVMAAALASTLAGTGGIGAGWLQDLLPGLPSMPTWNDLSALFVDAAPIVRAGLVLGVTTWLVLAPVALYFALRRE
jgi:anti-sigma factor RsiW